MLKKRTRIRNHGNGRMLSHEQLECRRVFNVQWRNPVDSLDVDASGFIVPLDALKIINELNVAGARRLPDVYATGIDFIDVTGDQFVSPLDALVIINHLNSNQSTGRILQDSEALETAQEIEITVGGNTGARVYSMDIEAQLGQPSGSRLFTDLFSVYLVGPGGPTATLLDRGQKGTSLFSLSSRGTEIATGLAQWDGKTLQIDLSSIHDLDTAILKLQLLNNDPTTSSRVLVRPLQNANDSERVASALESDSKVIFVPGGPANETMLTLSTTVQPIVENTRFDAATGELKAEMYVRNLGTAVGRDVFIIFPGLPSNVSIVNASGTLSSGVPFLSLRNAIGSGGIPSNDSSGSIELVIESLDKRAFNLLSEVFVGLPNQAPELPSMTARSIKVGEVLSLTLAGSDSDDDQLTYSVRDSLALPASKFNSATGTLSFYPQASDVGTYQVTVSASDGVATSTRTFELQVVPDPITTTRVIGKVLDVDQTPLPGLTVQIGAVQTLTRSDGSFQVDLGNGPVPSDTIKIRGENYLLPNQPDVRYPFIAEKLRILTGFEPRSNQINQIERPIYLPKLNRGTRIEPTRETVVSQFLYGDDTAVKVEVAAGTLFNQLGTPFDGELSITEVPVGLTPAALPDGMQPDLVVTIQPGEMSFSRPTPLTTPNRAGWAPGTVMDLWSINPSSGEFDKVGIGQVSQDGKSVQTISGGIRNSSWHFFILPEEPQNNFKPQDNPRNEDGGCDSCSGGGSLTSVVNYFTGGVTETHNLVTYQSAGVTRGLSLVYDSLRADPRPIIHGGILNAPASTDFLVRVNIQHENVDYRVPGFVPSPSSSIRDLPDLQGGEHFFRTPDQEGVADYGLQLDLGELPTAVYSYNVDIGFTRYWTAVVCIGSTFRLEDGRLACSGRAGSAVRSAYTMSSSAGELIYVNGQASPYGSGWGVAGLQEVVEQASGNVLIVDGDGSELLFDAPAESGQPYVNPPGHFSTLVKLNDGTFQSTQPDQTVTKFGSNKKIASITDRNGNQTKYTYDGANRLLSIIDPVGLETRLSYVGNRLSQIIDPAGRKTQIEHDVKGNLVRVVDPDGSARTWGYDSRSHMTTEVDQLGRTERTVYDDMGRAKQAIRKDGSVINVRPLQTQGVVDASLSTNPSRPVASRDLGTASATYLDANGNTLRLSLDRAGQITSSRDNVGALGSTTRDEHNLVTATVDALGNRTNYNYDSQGNLTAVYDELSRPTGNSLFLGQIFYGGESFRALTTADFNNDGLVDLATANFHFDNVAVYFGNDQGTFSPPIGLATGRNPTGISSGDLNGDGYVDVVATSGFSSSELSIFFGNGDGTFQLQTVVALDELDGARSVIIADSDADGLMDLITANANANSVSVIRGRADGSFSAPVRFGVGLRPYDLKAVDLNSDGNLDIVTVNSQSDDISVLLGRGQGEYSDQVRYRVGATPLSLVVADFDLDTHPDIAVGNGNGVTVTVFLGTGDGRLNAPTDVDVGYGVRAVGAADLNEDNAIDLVTVSNNYTLSTTFLGRGDGGFGSPREFVSPTLFDAIALSDASGDGKLDLIAAGYTGFSVMKGNGAGDLASIREHAVGQDAKQSVIGDVNGDRQLDVIIANADSKDLSILLGRGDGTFLPEFRQASGIVPKSMAIGDVNGDGKLDLAVAVTNAVMIYLGAGDGSFSFSQTFDFASSPNSVLLPDLNSDGLLDLVVAQSSVDELVIFFGVGAGSFGQPVLRSAGKEPSSVEPADLNGDGILDLMVLNPQTSEVRILLGNGNGNFSDGNLLEVGGAPGQLVYGDFNGDKRIDIAVVNRVGQVTPSIVYGDVSVLLGNGDGTFKPQVRYPTLRASSESLVSRDFNSDGILDLATANESWDVSLLLGRGDGTFENAVIYGSGQGTNDIDAADLNGDGDSDIVVTNYSSVSVLLGRGGQLFAGSQPRTFAFDSQFSQLTRVVDEAGRKTLYEVDPTNGNRLEEARQVGLPDSATNGESDDVVTRYTYTASGQWASTTDPLGRITQYEYDERERRIRTTFAVGTAQEATRRYEYSDLTGNLTATIDENSNRTEYKYDLMNRVIEVKEADPDGAGPQSSPVTEYAYDARGNRVSQTDPMNVVTRYAFDSRDRLVQTTDAQQNKTNYQYDLSDNLRFVVDPLGNKSEYRYDARNRIIESIDAIQAVTKFKYDAADNLLILTDPVGNQTSYLYDNRKRIIQETDPLGSTTKYRYDLVDNMVRKTDRNGRGIVYAYDDLNRLVSETWGRNDNVVEYAYDLASNLIQAKDNVSSLAFVLDARNRVTSVDNAGSAPVPNVVISYTYDAVGNVLAVKDSLGASPGATTSYSYDRLNRMASVSQSGPGTSDKRVDFGYNAAGQFAQLSRYADVVGTQLVVSSSYAYDSLNRLSDLRHTASSNSLASYVYSYDTAGRVSSLTDRDGLSTYAYDRRGQLVAATHTSPDIPDEAYAYDKNGNRTSSSKHVNGYSIDSGNRLISDGVYTYEYDLEGSLSRRTEIATGHYRQFRWDHRNRLMDVTDNSRSGEVIQRVTFYYDALDRRIGQEVARVGEDTVVSQFIYDREDVIIDFEGNSTLTNLALKTRYLHGPDVDQVFSQEDASNGVLWHLGDHLSTTRDIASSEGKIANHLVYDSYGNLLAESEPSITSRYRFTGREYIPELDLYSYRYRYFDHNIGMFLQNDPLGFLGGDTNLRRYVSNSPITAADPFGLQAAPRSEPSPYEKIAQAAVKKLTKPGIKTLTTEEGTGPGAAAAAANGPETSTAAGKQGGYSSFQPTQGNFGSLGYQGEAGSIRLGVGAGAASLSSAYGRGAMSYSIGLDGTQTGAAKYGSGSISIQCGFQKKPRRAPGGILGVGFDF